MSDDKVVPFRPRPPSKAEIAVYEAITRNWQPELRQRMFPEHFRQHQKEGRGRIK